MLAQGQSSSPKKEKERKKEKSFKNEELIINMLKIYYMDDLMFPFFISRVTDNKENMHSH